MSALKFKPGPYNPDIKLNNSSLQFLIHEYFLALCVNLDMYFQLQSHSIRVQNHSWEQNSTFDTVALRCLTLVVIRLFQDQTGIDNLIIFCIYVELNHKATWTRPKHIFLICTLIIHRSLVLKILKDILGHKLPFNLCPA